MLFIGEQNEFTNGFLLFTGEQLLFIGGQLLFTGGLFLFTVEFHENKMQIAHNPYISLLFHTHASKKLQRKTAALD